MVPRQVGKTMPISVTGTRFHGVVILAPKRFRDGRGFFQETWSRRDLHEVGIDVDFVQDNQSYSEHVWTVRGLHVQAPPHAQDKLVRCIRGAILDVVVDVRQGSESYGHWLSFELSRENGFQLFVPKGFLHGFLTLQPDTEIVYKCSDYYSSTAEVSVRWDSVGIDWPISGAPILSQKDASAIPLSEFQSPFILGVNS